MAWLRKRGKAVSVRRAPAAATSTTPPTSPVSTAKASIGRQRRRRSARKISQAGPIGTI